MARKKRKAVDDEKPNTDAGDATTELGGTQKARKRFVGIRQRPSGRWVAEIKDTIQKIRMWLGTFDTAEEAARAYDEAACLLRGANTRTNFWPTSPNSSPALSSKITNLLLSRLKARNNALAANNNFEPSSPPRKDQNQENQYLYASDFPDILYEDFSLENFSRAISDYKYPILETGEGHEMQTGALDSIQYCSENTEISENENDVEEGNATGLEDVDFEFVDETGWSAGCSAFDLAEEMEKPMEAEEDEAVMMSEAMRRMTYERKFSASLYAFSGVTEYLNLKLKKSSLERSEQLSGLRNACKSKQEEMVSSKDKEDHSSDFDDAELSLWSSIDLHPLCFVNKSKTHRRDVH